MVADLAPKQQHVATAFGHRRRVVRGDLRTALDHHVAGCRSMREAVGGGGQVIAERRHEAAALRVAVQTFAELRVTDVDRRRSQVLDVDLAAAVEHHTVAVDQHHRALALDAAEDLRRTRGRVVDPVEQRPAGLLVEIDHGVAADVEGFPVEDGLVSGLRDADRGGAVLAALHRPTGVEPALGQRIVIDLQATVAKAIAHHAAAQPCRIARALLQALLHGDRLRGGA
ncbi:hypothetical protein D3C72_1352450 [compost metagenome]